MLEDGLPFIVQSSISFPRKVELKYGRGIPLVGGKLTGSIAERSSDNLLIMSCGRMRLDENLGKGLVG